MVSSMATETGKRALWGALGAAILKAIEVLLPVLEALISRGGQP
jgi:hypothetical protein